MAGQGWKDGNSGCYQRPTSQTCLLHSTMSEVTLGFQFQSCWSVRRGKTEGGVRYYIENIPTSQNFLERWRLLRCCWSSVPVFARVTISSLNIHFFTAWFLSGASEALQGFPWDRWWSTWPRTSNVLEMVLSLTWRMAATRSSCVAATNNMSLPATLALSSMGALASVTGNKRYHIRTLVPASALIYLLQVDDNCNWDEDAIAIGKQNE